MGDPSDPLSLNRYVYCGMDPVNFVDSNGHFAIALPLIYYGGSAAVTAIGSWYLANAPAINDIWKSQLKALFAQMEMIEQETEKNKQEIYQLGYRLFKVEITILLSIKGFSPLTAIALMSDVIDINRFPSVKKFCAYLRTAPKVKSSNDKTVIGSTNKFSRTLTCSLMSQSNKNQSSNRLWIFFICSPPAYVEQLMFPAYFEEIVSEYKHCRSSDYMVIS